MEASGAIGLPKGRSDSLAFTFTLDSLGGLRRYLSSADSNAAAGFVVRRDRASRGFAQGRLDSLRLAGTLTGDQLYFAKDKSRLADGRVRHREHSERGGRPAHVSAPTRCSLGGVALDTLGGTLIAEDASHARFTVGRAKPQRSARRWRAERGAC